MIVFGNRDGWTRLGVALACGVLVSAAVVRADGTLKLTATSSLVNPCNGEFVTGAVDVELVVQTNVNKNRTHVVIHRSFHGTLDGNQGNSYKVSSIANDQQDALGPYYDTTFENNVIGHGRAPDFTVTGNLRVFVNANQEPTGYSASGVSATCK